jgi:hypothetical protein
MAETEPLQRNPTSYLGYIADQLEKYEELFVSSRNSIIDQLLDEKYIFRTGKTFFIPDTFYVDITWKGKWAAFLIKKGLLAIKSH